MNTCEPKTKKILDYHCMEKNARLSLHANGESNLNKSPLDVARLGSLDGRVDETFATTHRVEKELGGQQAGQVRVLDESACFRTVVVLNKMRQGAPLEAIRNTLSLNVLLAHTSDYLQRIWIFQQYANCRSIVFQKNSILKLDIWFYVYLRNVDVVAFCARDDHRFEVVMLR